MLLQIYHEGLGHPAYEEPKQYDIRDINSIMKNYAAGWKAFENPRHFPPPYNRQKGWERVEPPDNGGHGKSGFQPLPEGEAVQLGLPKEWLEGENHSRLPAGCPSRCQARCREGAYKCRISGLFFPDNESNGKTERKSIRTENGKPGFVCGVLTSVVSPVVRLPPARQPTLSHPDGTVPGIFMEVNAYGKTSRLSGAEPEQKKKVQFIVSREFAGSQTMQEAFEQLIERQTCERFEEWQKRQAS